MSRSKQIAQIGIFAKKSFLTFGHLVERSLKNRVFPCLRSEIAVRILFMLHLIYVNYNRGACMYHLGIDPGQKGGIAMISAESKMLWAETMPDNLLLLKCILEAAKGYGRLHAWVEKAQVFPKQGLVSAFNYGRHFGELCTSLTLLEIPYTLVSPVTWTKKMHLGVGIKDPKKKTLAIARRLYPKEKFLATDRSKVPHSGIVDAVIIARYGLQFGGIK